MKMLRYGILVVTLIIGITFVSQDAYAGGNRITYRPVTLTVLDAETKQPLEGISIIVVNVIGYERHIIIDAIRDVVVHFYEFTTDEHGVVRIPQFSYRVSRHHYLHSQRIGLNVELRNPMRRIRRDQRTSFVLGEFSNYNVFFSPRSELKMGLLTYGTHPLGLPRLDGRTPAGGNTTIIHEVYEVPGWRQEQTRFPSDHAMFTFYLGQSRGRR